MNNCTDNHLLSSLSLDKGNYKMVSRGIVHTTYDDSKFRDVYQFVLGRYGSNGELMQAARIAVLPENFVNPKNGRINDYVIKIYFPGPIGENSKNLSSLARINIFSRLKHILEKNEGIEFVK